jgi:hypothetical protein
MLRFLRTHSINQAVWELWVLLLTQMAEVFDQIHAQMHHISPGRKALVLSAFFLFTIMGGLVVAATARDVVMGIFNYMVRLPIPPRVSTFQNLHRSARKVPPGSVPEPHPFLLLLPPRTSYLKPRTSNLVPLTSLLVFPPAVLW